ncbi:MAG: excinuclease ABC subunit UvrC [Pseudomonadota bacterium]|nr:excinuclease ABC subunit UvrC [Pseudomonadota bacterium]
MKTMGATETSIATMVRSAPRAPGVYLMRDAVGEIVYVGKAKDLRARLRNYVGGTDGRGMIPFLLSRVRRVEWILTATEKEALILENNLIKEHLPRYNVVFRDDKDYFHIRMDVTAPFPRWQLVRRPKKDGARYFGPYPSSGAAKETLRFLQTAFPLRTCRDAELRNRRRPCLEYQIGRCPAPCVQLVDEEAYGRSVRQGLAFLEGNAAAAMRDLEERMNNAAAELRFEEAAALRDRIGAIRATLERQRTASMGANDQDVFGAAREGDWTQLCLLRIRAGKMVGMRTFPLLRVGQPLGEIMTAAVMQFYDAGHEVPGEILLPEAGEDRRVLSEWLGEKKGRRVRLHVPQRGRGRALVEMAERNAKEIMQTVRGRQGPEEDLRALAAALDLRRLPERIECFDISNIGGRSAVGSMATFVGGVPRRSGYRRFRIRAITGADDCAMMREVLVRRLATGKDLPDLLVVDGGKGQLAAAVSVLEELRIQTTDVVALAKKRDFPLEDRRHGPLGGGRRSGAVGAVGEASSGGMERNGRRLFPSATRLPEGVPGREEGGREALGSKEAGAEAESGRPGRDRIGDRVFLPGRKEPLFLSRRPNALRLLQRLRDEAHRFAVTYHRRVRERENFASPLDRIAGLGPDKKKALLGGLGDLERIRKATAAELRTVPGIGVKLASRIEGFFAASLDNAEP